MNNSSLLHVISSDNIDLFLKSLYTDPVSFTEELAILEGSLTGKDFFGWFNPDNPFDPVHIK